jgi:hypothetical protein
MKNYCAPPRPPPSIILKSNIPLFASRGTRTLSGKFEQTKTNNCTMSSEPKACIVSDPTKGVKVNASVVAQKFREEIKEKVRKLKESGIGEFQ